ncbi:MAG TPA: hypothetical protein VHG91_16330 [Longimicrobium sp.]|nr:hypothetical protein [Longimicrobium sp.]
MSKLEKLLEKLLGGNADRSFAFEDLRYVLLRLGFEEEINAGHHMFTLDGVDEQVNIQRMRFGKDAKPYQMRQVRKLILKYRLAEGGPDDEV